MKELKFPEDADTLKRVPNPYGDNPPTIEVLGYNAEGRYIETAEARKARHDQARRLGWTSVRSPVDFSDEPIDAA